MGIEYLGLSNINGPLVILEGVQDAFLMRSLNLRLMEKQKRLVELLNYTRIKQSFRYLKERKICLLIIQEQN